MIINKNSHSSSKLKLNYSILKSKECKSLILLILVIIGNFHVCYSAQNENDSALTIKINLDCKKCTRAEVFEKIENKVDYYFSYSEGVFNEQGNYNFKFRSCELKIILDSIIRKEQIEYKVIGKHIVLYKKNIQVEKQIITENIKTDTFLIVRARVIDLETKDPLPLASVYIFGTTLGTVSNNEGDFILKIPSKFSKRDIVVSSLGYKNYIAPAFIYQQLDEIKLIPEYIPIQQVIIKRKDPIFLLQSSLNLVCDNYYTNPVNYTSFYRETIKNGEKYDKIIEAVLNTYKQGYCKEYTQDRIKIIKGRQFVNYQNIDTFMLKIKAGLNATIVYDVIKNLNSYEFLSSILMNRYKYTMYDINVDNDKTTYVISFKQKQGIHESLYEGTIHLDMRTYAITKIEFSLNKQGIEKEWIRYIYKKPNKLKVKLLEAKFSASYKEYNGKYFLNVVTCDIKFNFRYKRKFRGAKYNTKIEMGVTEIDTINIKKFKYREKVNPETILEDMVENHDDKFWTQYNFIKQEEDIEKTIQTILDKN